MAAKFKAGQTVQQVMPAPISGVIVRFQFDEGTGDVHYIVEDADGNEHSFSEEQIEVAPE